MIGIDSAVKEAFEAQLSANLANLSVGDRRAIAKAFHDWFSGTRKRTVPDLNEKIEKWMRRLAALADNLELEVSGGKLTVSTNNPDSAEALELMARGSDWFEGSADPAALVARALLG